MDRPAARGHSEHDRPLDHFDGHRCVGSRARAWRDRVVRSCSLCVIALATPPLYTTWRPRWLPWYLESYINGVHTFNSPQAWLFPDFPVGSDSRLRGSRWDFSCSAIGDARIAGTRCRVPGAGGVVISACRVWLRCARAGALRHATITGTPAPIFSWRALGVMMAMMPFAYAWCRWGPRRIADSSPLVQMGQTSLLVYWVHIIFVYGSFSLLRKGAAGHSDGDVRNRGDHCRR